MDDLRLHAVVAQVVAWHNRHPLARRITAAQVDSVGYVALPYTAPGLLPPPPAAPPTADSGTPPPQEPVAEAAGPEPMREPSPDPEPEPAPVETSPQAADDTPATAATDDPAAIVIDVDPGLPAPAPAPPAVSALRARVTAGEGEHAAAPAAPAAALPAPGAPRKLVCSEDFMAPMPVKKVLGWVQTHGRALAHAPTDGPVRRVAVDTALLPDGAGLGLLWVATAAIGFGGKRHRVLLGGGAAPALLGRRLWSLPRLLGAAATPCVLAAALVWAVLPAATDAALPAAGLAASGAASASAPVSLTVSPMATASAAADAASAALVASAASAAPPPPSATATATASASASASASAPDASASASASANAVAMQAAPAGGNSIAPRRPGLPGLLDDAAKAEARAAVAALRAERQAKAPVPAASQAAAATSLGARPLPAPTAPPAARAAPLPSVLFALSTRPLRTRAEAEQLASAFQSLLAGAPGSAVRVEMLPAGEDWRVVVWPYESRAGADRAQAVLRNRGLRVDLVDF